jgi:hypothetical protein
VTLLAVASFVYGAMNLVCGGFMLLGGAAVGMLAGAAASSGEAEAEGAAKMVGIGAGLMIAYALFLLAFAGANIIGGIGVIMRARWGRVVTLICGGLAVIFGALAIFSIVQGGFVPGAISLLLNGGYAALAFALLLQSKYANEFR